MNDSTLDHVIAERRPGGMGLITLNRPQALNALSLEMIRALTTTLRAWQHDAGVKAVAIRGMGKSGEGFAPFGAFCAGGDIRFFHQAALVGDAALGEFFTAEYALNHLIHTYGKPYMAFMDGIVMGGGMGLSQGAALRIVTERTKMAMPETRIGLFPDVGGGYFLSRLPGHLGEYLALTGHVLKGGEAVAARLADGSVQAAQLPAIWQHLADTAWPRGIAAQHWVASQFIAGGAYQTSTRGQIDHYFGLPTVRDIVIALEAVDSDWARHRGRVAHPLAADAARDAGAGAPRAPHEPGRRAAHGARSGAPLLSPARRRGQRDRRGHPRPGRRQGPHPALEPCTHRRHHARHGGAVLCQPLGGAGSPAGGPLKQGVSGRWRLPGLRKQLFQR